MSNEDLNQEEEVLETKPTIGSESDDATELDDLFADESQDEEVDVATLKKELSDLKKGLNKFFSEQGRKAKQPEEQKKETETKTVESDDVSELFFAQVKEAELVESDLRAVADKLYNGSILKAWKNERWLQEKAKAISVEKAEDEANRSKISKPSIGTTASKIDISKVKAEEVSSLPADKKAEWLREQVRRERESVE